MDDGTGIAEEWQYCLTTTDRALVSDIRVGGIVHITVINVFIVNAQNNMF